MMMSEVCTDNAIVLKSGEVTCWQLASFVSESQELAVELNSRVIRSLSKVLTVHFTVSVSSPATLSPYSFPHRGISEPRRS
eukprot:2881826-Pyramimonas_sp.AAC.1